MSAEKKSNPEANATPSFKPKEAQTLTTCLWFDGDCEKAMDYYKKNFPCKLIYIQKHDNTVVHACLQFGESKIFANDVYGDNDETGPKDNTTCNMILYVEDCDAMFASAVKAGCVELKKPETHFWGDRTGKVRDPFGHSWSFATRVFTPDYSKIMEEGEKWWKTVKNLKPRKRKAAEKDEKKSAKVAKQTT
ncbi:hypothetical protein AAMO2058_000555200 [Amorphochlora amoebiformis]